MRNRNLAPKSKSFLMGIGEGKCNIAFYIDTCVFFLYLWCYKLVFIEPDRKRIT